MRVCQLRLVNELNVTTDIVDFLSEPFFSPLNLRIPKATKRTVETADNMFRDGSDLSLIRYNNAVITMQPRMKFGCSGDEALGRIEAMRAKIDSILEAARDRAVKGYGQTVEFWDDTKGFTLVSRVLDGDYNIEEDWDWSNVAQGAVLNSSFSITREPFRTTPTRLYLENLCPNPGFEDASAVFPNIPSEWTVVNGLMATATDQKIEGARCGRLSYNASAVNDTILSSQDIPLTGGEVYYVEAWGFVSFGDSAVMEIYRPVSSTVLSPSVTFTTSQKPVVADDPRFYRDRRYNTWSNVDVGSAVPIGFLRKGFVFTAPVSDIYQIRFRVSTPVIDDEFFVDRVYLTPVSNLPYDLPTGTILDLASDTKQTADMKARYFPVGWISFRDIVNHNDNGTTDHSSTASGSASPSSSPSRSASRSASPSASMSVSPSASLSASPSASVSPSASASLSPSASVSASASPSAAAPDTTGNHINYVDFCDVPGDLPALTKIRIENTSGATLAQIFAGMRSFGSPAHQTNTVQASGQIDNEAAQGDKFVMGPLSATPVLMLFNFEPDHSINGLGNITGAFRIMIRARDLAAVQGNLRMRSDLKLMFYNTPYSNTDIILPGPGAAKWALVDAGVKLVPLVSPDGSINSFDSGQSLLYFWRTTGTENVEVDYCQLFPADEYFCAASPTWENGRFVNLSSLPELPTCYVERVVSAQDIRMNQIPAQSTSLPLLAPKRQNRLFLSATRALGEHQLNDSMRVAAQVLPRYL